MDFERYGDYTEYEDDIPKSKNKFLLTIKILILVSCFSIVGFLAFRLIVFNYYPDEMEDIYFTDNITAYYNATGGEIGAKTQMLRAPYDDPNTANFMCDNLIVIEGAGEIQFSMRYNLAAIENIKAILGLETLDPTDPEIFSFRLVGSQFLGGSPEIESNYKQTVVSASPSYVGTDSFLDYRYYKLAFDGIDFRNTYTWIRVEVFVKGQKSEEPFTMVAIYENNENYAEFDDFDVD